MSKHDVTRHKLAGRHETPSHFGSARFVELMNVRHYAVSHTIIYPVSVSAVATNDFEVVLVIKLGSLIWGKPVSQKSQAAGFRGILSKKASVQFAYSPCARNSWCSGVDRRTRNMPLTANEAREK